MEEKIVDFLFEVGILNKLPRSGFHFLGTGTQSVAEHSFRITIIGYCLANMEEDIDEAKLIKLCLLHDIPESRTGDLNYVQKKYVHLLEEKAIGDQAKGLPFERDYKEYTKEFKEGHSKEARLARDADQLELLLTLKQLSDIGNKKADEWIKFALKRLKTKSGRKLGEIIAKTPSERWWFIPDQEWWIHGKKIIIKLVLLGK